MRLIVWIECTGVLGALGDVANMAASLGGCKVADGKGADMVVVERKPMGITSLLINLWVLSCVVLTLYTYTHWQVKADKAD